MIQSTLVQVMAWCRQATSHYLSQCSHRAMSLYGITKPQWVDYTVPCQTLKIHWLSQPLCHPSIPILPPDWLQDLTRGKLYPSQCSSIHHYHIEAETRWPPFSKRHFQMDFLEWKFWLDFGTTSVVRALENQELSPGQLDALWWLASQQLLGHQWWQSCFSFI